MLSNEQKSLLKRAQKQAGLADAEYREALALIAGVDSSTDPRLGDRHLDKLMGYFEAIYWSKVAKNEALDPAGMVQAGLKALWLPFREQGYWAGKNTKTETSRDRYTQTNVADEVADLEQELYALGCNTYYVAAIRRNVCAGKTGVNAAHAYKFALQRTLQAKLKKKENQPF